MLASNTDTTPSDMVSLQIQLEVMRERDKHHLEKIAQLEQGLREAQIEIGVRDNELKQAVAQSNEQKAQLSTLKHKDEKIDELEKRLNKTQREFDLQTSCLETVTKYQNEQKTAIAVNNEKLKRYARNSLNDKFISILASLLFMLSAGLASLGYNLITSVTVTSTSPNTTSTSPSTMGLVLIEMAIAFHILATLLVTFVKGGSNS